MKIEKQIKYELKIDRKEGYGINYEGNLDNDLAGLMISLHVLEENVKVLKAQKKTATSKDKKIISSQINRVSTAAATISRIVSDICDVYEDYKKKQDENR